MAEHNVAATFPGDEEKNTTQWIVPDPKHLEALAEFAAGAGHEINNPLATIIGRAQQLLKDEVNPQRRQMLQSIGAQAYRIRDMIGDTMLFARPPIPELQAVPVADVVAKVIANEGKAPQHSLYHVDCSIPTDLMITADPAQFAIVLNELLRNSRQALQPSGGTIGLTASIAGEFVSLEIKDHGIGFSELERIHAFDPFFSGRQAGRGLGFGLCKCWQILRQHGGRIEIESAPGQATIVRSFWPLSQ